MLKIIGNAIIFQGGWILCVLYGNPVAVVVAAVATAIYLILYRQKSSDLLFIAFVVFSGWLGDSVLGLSGALVYPNGAFYPPLWLVTLWLLFATSLTWCLEWAIKRQMLFVIFCAIGGTLSYVIGVQLSDVVYGLNMKGVIITLVTIWTLYGIIFHQAYLRWRRGADL
ncbi:MAG: DUF2878 domain-containing protein [Acidiferrobacterales bacterium]|nr:DUF2878 domain-containing protein [Acidiferrobacterales bacterium]